METSLMRVAVTDAPDSEYMAPRPALASLNKANRVKLRLSQMAFNEACQVVGHLSVAFGRDVENDPWLDVGMAESRAMLMLMLDMYEAQMLPYVLSQPELVTITLSRCEAMTLWKVWMISEIPGADVPAFAAVLHELHHLFC